MATISEIKIKVTVYKQTWNSKDWPPDNALLCIAWFNEKINQIPKEHQNIAQICIESVPIYNNEAVPEIEIFYLRDLTNEEIIKQKTYESLSKSDRDLVQSLKILPRDFSKLSELFDRNAIYESVLSLLTQPVGVMEATPGNEGGIIIEKHMKEKP